MVKTKERFAWGFANAIFGGVLAGEIFRGPDSGGGLFLLRRRRTPRIMPKKKRLLLWAASRGANGRKASEKKRESFALGRTLARIQMRNTHPAGDVKVQLWGKSWCGRNTQARARRPRGARAVRNETPLCGGVSEAISPKWTEPTIVWEGVIWKVRKKACLGKKERGTHVWYPSSAKGGKGLSA